MVIKNGILEFLGVKHYVNNPSRAGHHYETGYWNGSELAKMDTIMASMDSIGKKHFEDYMETCSKEGIKVILVNSPVYAGATRKTKGLDNVNAYFDSIAKKIIRCISITLRIMNYVKIRLISEFQFI